MSRPWQGARVTVTGGSGFLGAAVVRQLRMLGAEVFVPRSREYDLVEASAAGRLRTLVLVGTACSYPKFTPVPFREEQLWNGYPEETNAPYGIAKKALLVMAQAYAQQYGLKSIYLIPINLYGPGDHFDLETSHVIPALIRKFTEAAERRDPEVVLWGTGRATREFLFVEDAAEGVLAAAARYEGAEPVNLPGGGEVSIRELAETLQQLTGFAGRIVWDDTKPDGQPRRRLDGTRAREAFGFSARTPLTEGLQRTLAWYREHAAAGALP